MKISLPSSLLAATLFGLLVLISPQALVLADATALFFAGGLGLWTVEQYGRRPSLGRVPRVILVSARPTGLAVARRLKPLSG